MAFSSNEMIVDVDIGMGGIKDKEACVSGHSGHLRHDDMEGALVYRHANDFVATDIVNLNYFHRQPLFLRLGKCQIFGADADLDFGRRILLW